MWWCKGAGEDSGFKEGLLRATLDVAISIDTVSQGDGSVDSVGPVKLLL